jgi:hypothetical protein
MAAGRAVTDFTLDNVLSGWRSLVGSEETDIVIGLFRNDVTITPGTVVGDLTECDFAGYGRAEVSVLDFGTDPTVDHVASISCSEERQFTNVGEASTTIYGYFALGAETDELLFAESFSAGLVLGPGRSVVVRLRLFAQSRNV